ncbi:putative defensin-like protein 298 [Prunus yedoensis var. nudiflora]|uniref:Putative defensin-like protein 298 n=1 Tax=Prunus yedoensis var. nudiflora TaxID=2094558 RepID=A0A314Y454_PRUYE|nr:putative defensin-like protein 298 [Prunus yedoensis var. nudiflora]
MEKAPSKIALNSLLLFLVVASCVSLFSMLPRGAEAILVKRCSTNDGCKAFPCTTSFAFCVNHLCTCQVANIIDDSVGIVQQNENGKCSSVADCEGIKCEDSTLECVDGVCKCVRSH